MSTDHMPHAWFLGGERVSVTYPDARTAQEAWVQGAELRPTEPAADRRPRYAFRNPLTGDVVTGTLSSLGPCGT